MGGRGVSFKNQVADEIKTLFELAQGNSSQTFSFEQIENLPEPVKRYFRFALTEGYNYISLISIKHDGLFRLKATHRWSSIKGEEYYTVNPPGFVWFAKLKTSPLFWITVRDSYLKGRGNVLAKAYSLFTVGTAEGSEIDSGALCRWLSEAVLFPTALLPNENLAWKFVDENSARLLFSHKGVSIAALVYFGRNGEIVRLTTDRSNMETGNFEKWSTYYNSYKDHNGIKIPTEAGAIWHLATGHFNYARFRITTIDYN